MNHSIPIEHQNRTSRKIEQSYKETTPDETFYFFHLCTSNLQFWLSSIDYESESMSHSLLVKSIKVFRELSRGKLL